MATIFFTDDMLATSIASAEGVMQEYVISPESREMLRTLKKRDAQVGIIFNTRHQPRKYLEKALSVNPLVSPIDLTLIVYSEGLTEQCLAEAAAKAKASAGRAYFVGKHCTERVRALKAGFDTAIPHPALLTEVMESGTLVYAQISKLHGEHRDERLRRLLRMPMVPLHLTNDGHGSAYIITSRRIAKVIGSMGFGLTVFGEDHDPQVTDLYLVRDDRRVPDGTTSVEYSTEFLEQQGKARFIVAVVDDAILLALPPHVSIQEIHFPKALHGHNRRLMADTTLVTRTVNDVFNLSTNFCLTLNQTTTLTVREKEALKLGITSERIKSLHAPYAGHVPLVMEKETHLIRSRHLLHPHNEIVTRALIEQLKKIGGGLLTVQPHSFVLGPDVFSNVEAELPGTEPDSFVIISAHFDSTAVNVDGFEPAPGADDDASGMAAVLAAAEVAVKLRREAGPFKRSLRFVLFNAEEGLILGSAEYARKQRKNNVKIAGVFQMDMIGFHGGQPSIFEIHAGYSNDAVTERCSLKLAARITEMASLVSPSLKNPQIYPRNYGRDPAQGNSDHTPFQERGYAACMISEDYNTDPGDPDPDPQINPDYHQSTDKEIDCGYAAEIARAVIATAFLTAKS